MKIIFVSILAGAWCGIASAQVAKTAEHPFFKSMLGNCIEEGRLLVPQTGKALSMKVTTKLKPAVEGVWVQEDGRAESDQFRFTFRWMFRVTAGKEGEVVIGRFIDSSGQIQEYAGSFADDETLVLKRKSREGSYETTVAREGGGKWSVRTVFQPVGADKPIVLYEAEKTRSGS